MDETNRNSMKLDIEAVRLSAAEEVIPKESYKALPEGGHSDELDNVPLDNVKNSNMVKEKVSPVEDGADEKMLDSGNGSDEKSKLSAKKDEIKFIQGDHVNGDAKIDIGTVDKSFSALTKDELMKYSNDPFWVRLRWILFVLFWALWVAMLVGAILIIIHAPKCAAPVPLPWYKKGSFVMFDTCESAVEAKNVESVKSINTVRGVICEIPALETYDYEPNDVLKKMIDTYKEKDIKVIIDLEPNFVSITSNIFKEASNNNDYSAFVENSVPLNTWKPVISSSSSAWYNVSSDKYLLSQFGVNNLDLRMDNPMIKEKLKEVLLKLSDAGVRGFRFTNAKHFVFGELKEEDLTGTDSSKYESYTHSHSSYVSGLENLLQEYRNYIRNITDDEGFLSVTNIIERVEAFKINYEFVIDLPRYDDFPMKLAEGESAGNLYDQLNRIFKETGNKTFLTWQLSQENVFNNINVSEYNMFMMLLPGVPVSTLNYLKWSGSGDNELKKLRESGSFQHGEFLLNTTNGAIFYTRFKSGNPGLLVALNPSDNEITLNVADHPRMPSELLVLKLSDNYNCTGVSYKSKLDSDNIKISKYSAIIMSYIPKSD